MCSLCLPCCLHSHTFEQTFKSRKNFLSSLNLNSGTSHLLWAGLEVDLRRPSCSPSAKVIHIHELTRLQPSTHEDSISRMIQNLQVRFPEPAAILPLWETPSPSSE